MSKSRSSHWSWRILKVFLILLVVFALLVVGALLLLPNFIDAHRVTALVEQQTGRKMEAENIGVTVFPWAGVTLDQVKLANAPGFEQDQPYFAEVDKLHIQIKLLPLISQQVELSTLTLHGLRLNLARKADSTVNWYDLLEKFGQAGESAPEETPSPEESPTSEEKPAQGGMPEIRLGGLDLQDANVSWDDAMTDQKYVIAGLYLKTGKVSLPGDLDLAVEMGLDLPAGQTLPVNGKFQFKGHFASDAKFQQFSARDFQFDAQVAGEGIPNGSQPVRLELASLSAAMGERVVQVQGLKLSAAGIQAQVDGDAKHQGIPEFNAQLRVAEFDPRATLKQLGIALPALPLPDMLQSASLQVDASGKIAPAGVEGEGVVARNFMLKVDDHVVSAPELRVSLAEQTLNLPKLDLKALGIPLNLQLQAQKILSAPEFSGKLNLAEFAPKTVLEKLGQTLPPIPETPLAKASLASTFSGTPQKITLRDTQLRVDGHQVDLPETEVSLAKQTVALKNLAVRALGLELGGTLNVLLGTPSAYGELKVSPFDAQALLKRLGQPPIVTSDAKVLRKVAMTTSFEAGTNLAKIHSVNLTLDDSTLKGHLLVDRFAPLKVQFGLDLNQIDVDRYLPPTATQPEAKTPAPQPGGGPVALPLEMLRGVDADGTLAVGRLRASGLKINDITLKISSHGGKAVIEPAAGLYQGGFKGKVILDATRNPPTATVQKNLNGIQAEPLLTDLQRKPSQLIGRGDLNINMRMANASTVQSLQQSAEGDISFAFSNGAIKGFNLAHSLRQAEAVVTGKPMPKQEGSLQTDFTELRGSLHGQNGVFRNDDLFMSAPVLRVEGQGTINVNAQEVDYLLNVHVVNTLTGQGGKGLDNLRDLRIPVRIQGGFAQPSIKVDLKDLLKEQAKRAAQKQLEKHQDKIQQKLQQEIGEKAGGAVLEGLKGLFQ